MGEINLTVLWMGIAGLSSSQYAQMMQIVSEHAATYSSSESETFTSIWLDEPVEDLAPGFTNDAQALNAVHCAMGLRRWLSNQASRSEPSPMPAIGVHTGPGIVENRASQSALSAPDASEYVVGGECVGMAAYIADRCQDYRAPILLSGSTYQRIRLKLGCRLVDRIEVTALPSPLALYQPLADLDSPEWSRVTPLIRTYELAWHAADSGAPQDAARIFGELARAGDRLSEMHSERLLKQPNLPTDRKTETDPSQ